MKKSIGKNGAKDPNIETFRLRMAALEEEKKRKRKKVFPVSFLRQASNVFFSVCSSRMIPVCSMYEQSIV